MESFFVQSSRNIKSIKLVHTSRIVVAMKTEITSTCKYCKQTL